MRLRTLALLAPLAACGSEPEVEQSTATFELRPVVATEIARLEALVAPVGSDLGEPEDPEAFREEVAGLVYLVSSGGRLASTAFDELERIGPDATPVLASFLTDGQVGDNEVAAAIDLLAALDHPLAASHLMTQAESHAAPWARARSAWRLGEGTQDWLVPRLLYRLKYEPDHLSALWLCASLAKHGNYSGLTVLRDLATTGSDQGVRDQAAQLAASIPADLGFESLDHVIWEWERGDPEGRLAVTEFSDRYTLAAWRRIVMLDDFQLRPVDDARYILARLGTEVAPWLAQALHDESRRIRLHAAQCLERLGRRGASAGPELVRALALPDLAPQAALALGRVGYPECEPALIELLGRDRPPDMRNAAARALGNLGLETSRAALAACLAEDEAIDLRQVAAEGVLYCGDAAAALPVLLACMTDERVDGATSEAALGWWLDRLVADGSGAAEAVREEWLTHAAPPGVVEQTADALERRGRRVAVIEAAADELLAQ